MKAFEVNVKGREWASVIRAETAGKAKYEYLLDVQDSWPDISFKDLTCHTLKTIPLTKQEIAEREAAAFNARHPLGTLVNYWSMLKEGELLQKPDLQKRRFCRLHKYFDHAKI